jgi:hypothetical protein
MLRRVALVRTDVSEELSASFIRVTRISELRTTLCSFLHLPVTLFLLGPKILLSTLFSNTLILCSSMSETKFHTHTEPEAKS